MSELATIVKVMMMALGNSSEKLENFLLDMEQYFLATSINLEECQLNRVTMFLTDAVEVWWRMRY